MFACARTGRLKRPSAFRADLIMSEQVNRMLTAPWEQLAGGGWVEQGRGPRDTELFSLSSLATICVCACARASAAGTVRCLCP